MRQLNHPNILKVFDVIYQDKTTSLVLEYMEAGSMSDLIKQLKVLSEDLLKKIVF